MTDQTLLSKARKTRFDDLPNFSGHPSEDVERFSKSIKNITKATDESNNHEILEMVRGKLTQSAGLWFDDNEHNFRTWFDFEIQFRNRYFSTTMTHTKFDKLKQRIQLPDEPVTSYIDDVINLCREIDPHMSDSIIIQHLMSSLNPDFRKEISRRESCMNTLSEFFEYAKIEQDLYDTFEKSRHLILESKHSNFTYKHTTIPSLTAMIKQPKQHYQIMKVNDPIRYDTSSMQRSVFKRNSDYSPESQSTVTSNKQIQMNLSQKPFTQNILMISQHFNINLIIEKSVVDEIIEQLIVFANKQLTIPDQHGQLISIPYVEPSFINYPALLVHQITLPPHSQTLVDITCQVNNAHNIIFEPYAHLISKFIFIPHTLLNINNNQAKISNALESGVRLHNYQHFNGKVIERYFYVNTSYLSNDLQKHLRAECYSDQIRKQILDSTIHIENPKHRLAIQDILWRNKILFDPIPSTINIPPQSTIKTGDHPHIYSKQYPASHKHKDQDIKFQETQKLLERGQIEESTSP
ncbi:unnamed protein product [Rotaria magnacalcarata]